MTQIEELYELIFALQQREQEITAILHFQAEEIEFLKRNVKKWQKNSKKMD